MPSLEHWQQRMHMGVLRMPIHCYIIHLYLTRNTVAQANETATSKNTTQEKEKKHNDIERKRNKFVNNY